MRARMSGPLVDAFNQQALAMFGHVWSRVPKSRANGCANARDEAAETRAVSVRSKSARPAPLALRSRRRCETTTLPAQMDDLGHHANYRKEENDSYGPHKDR